MWYLIVLTIHFPYFGPVDVIKSTPKIFHQKEECMKEVVQGPNILSGCFFRKNHE